MVLNCGGGEDSWQSLGLQGDPARSNWFPILKEISPEYSLEELMLKLKLQYFGHLMWRTGWLEKILMLGRIDGRKRRGWDRMRWLDGITNSMDMSLSKLQELSLVYCSPWSCKKSDRSERLNWTYSYRCYGEPIVLSISFFSYNLRFESGIIFLIEFPHKCSFTDSICEVSLNTFLLPYIFHELVVKGLIFYWTADLVIWYWALTIQTW